MGERGRPNAPRGEDSGDFMRVKHVFLPAFLLLVLAACGTPPKDALPPKSPDQVTLTSGDITNRPYRVLKDIEVTVSKPNVFADDPTQKQVAAALRKKAAEMGADAVVFVRYGALGMGLFNWGEIKGRGRAIVFTHP